MGIKQEQIRAFSGRKWDVGSNIIVLSKKITTTPRRKISRYVYSHVYRNLVLLDRVESKKTGNRKLADGGRDHNPRREVAYGSSNIPSKS